MTVINPSIVSIRKVLLSVDFPCYTIVVKKYKNYYIDENKFGDNIMIIKIGNFDCTEV